VEQAFYACGIAAEEIGLSHWGEPVKVHHL
jgi:hypothetical protein